MVPAVLIAQERDPLAVRRWPGLGSGFAAVWNTPELFLGDVMDGVGFPVGGVRQIDRIFPEVFRFPYDTETPSVYPGQAAVLSGRADRHRLASGGFHRVNLPRNVLPDPVNNLPARIAGSFIVIDSLETGSVGKAGAVRRPNRARNAYVVLRHYGLASVGQRAHHEIALVDFTCRNFGTATHESNAWHVRD